MKKIISLQFVFILIISVVPFFGNGQLEVKIPKDLDKFKKGTTFVVMKDPNSDRVQEYIKVFKENWKFNSIKFISYEEVAQNIAPENTFLSLAGLEVPKNSVTLMFFYMEFWYCEESFIKKIENSKKDKSFKIQKTEIAKIELYVDKAARLDPDLIIEGDFDGEGHIRNWGPGFVKNHIQTLTGFLERKENRGLAMPVLDQAKMNKLKTETLYLPQHALNKYNNMNGSGDDSTYFKDTELLKEYKYKYEIIQDDELNKMILEDEDGFKYFMFVQSGNYRHLVLVNSLSGEWIFSRKSIGFSIGPNDFKLLQSIVDKKPK